MSTQESAAPAPVRDGEPPVVDDEASSEESKSEEAAVEPGRDGDLAGFSDHLRLETRAGTIAYWVGVSLVALALFVPKLLPCVDYPQHLALADIARRLSDPNAPEHATHQLNYFTYNGLFHVLVARMARVMPIELAGRIMVSGSLVLLGAASLALLRVLRRPAWYATLFVPMIFSFAVGWGFVNYALGTAIAITALVFVAKGLRRPSVGTFIATAVLGLLCAMTHVLAMLMFCLLAAAIAPETAFRAVRARSGVRVVHAVLRMIVALAPILAGAAWCIAVYREQYAWDPVMYKDATLEGTAPPIWQKIAFFASWATGIHSDLTDQGLVWLALATCVVALVVGVRRLRRGEAWDGRDGSDAWDGELGAPMVLPFVAALVAYLVTPMVFIGTHLIFPRLTQALVLCLLLALPRITSERLGGARLRLVGTVIAVLTGVNVFVHSIAYAAETNDASRVIDDMPPGRRLTAVIYGADTFSFRHGALVHVAAMYAARKQGDWAFSFARFLSVPVRFKPGGNPAWPKQGWEFGGADYNPRCKYARHFDLVLLKSPRTAPGDTWTEPQVRKLVFGRDADAVKLVSHHGRFWGFDTAGLPDDGTY